MPLIDRSLSLSVFLPDHSDAGHIKFLMQPIFDPACRRRITVRYSRQYKFMILWLNTQLMKGAVEDLSGQHADISEVYIHALRLIE